MKRYLILTSILLLSISTAFAKFSLDIEAGGAFTGYNDVRIPNNMQSTRFSFTDDLKSDPVFSYRLNLHYRIHARHRISLLYTPLKITPEGSADRDLIYQGTTFSAGDELSAVYRFDSYRLQYRYYFPDQRKFIRGIGLSIKLRDAEISVSDGDQTATKTDTGVVPLINFLFAYDLTPEWRLILDGEALASPFGRAADVLAALKYDLNDRYSLKVGYRILEGGSDVDAVYTFALIHYAVVGLIVKF